MAGNTDFLRLSDHKVFKTLQDTLPKNLKTTQNVLVIRDDVLYTWDFQSNCVLTLNVKSVRSRPNKDVIYQTLLPTQPPLFTPNLVTVNDSGTLLAVSGANGVLVLELPHKYPPHGTFSGNKELVYCRSHSLDERLLACNIHTEVRQVKFHPGSINDTHLVVLTSDNVLRFYNIENSSAEATGAHKLGRQPMGFVPGSKRAFLESLGDTAVDFDFGPPEIAKTYQSRLSQTVDFGELKAITWGASDVSSVVNESARSDVREANVSKRASEDVKRAKWNTLRWPIYVLRGDSTVFVFLGNLYDKSKPELRGPLNCFPDSTIDYSSNSCALLCLKTNPPVLCCAKKKGLTSHFVVLPAADDEDYVYYRDEDEEDLFEASDRTLFEFETVELELGLSTVQKTTNYHCPIFLHRDESNVSRYFATHNTGVHSVTIRSVDDLQKFVVDKNDTLTVDLFKQPSQAEYLICTKTQTSDDLNPVIGFTIYYDPISVVSLLADGRLITLSLLSATLLPAFDDFDDRDLEEMNSPLKKMLREPFDLYIQKILQRVNTQPILKMSANGERSPQECYELLQRASKVFREEYFQYHDMAREELEKRAKALQMLKNYQQNQVDRMSKEKWLLKETAECLAEKYEDIKDKQDELAKRCQGLLTAISQKKLEPSDAERKFMEQLKEAKSKVERYQTVIERVKKTQKYNEAHMDNWRQQRNKTACSLSPVQSETIKNNLQDMTAKIAELVRGIKSYKKILNLQ